MAGKLSLLVGFGAGYVLGARSGRDRYDQIAAKAQELWRDPRVQDKADQAQQIVQDRAAQAGQAIKEKVSDTVTSDSSGGADANRQSGTTAKKASGGSTTSSGPDAGGPAATGGKLP